MSSRHSWQSLLRWESIWMAWLCVTDGHMGAAPLIHILCSMPEKYHFSGRWGVYCRGHSLQRNRGHCVWTCAAHHCWSAGQQLLTVGLDCHERLGPVECAQSARKIYSFSPGSESSRMTLLSWIEIRQGSELRIRRHSSQLMCIQDWGKIRGISASLVTKELGQPLNCWGCTCICVWGWHMRAEENMKTKLSNGFAVGLNNQGDSNLWCLAPGWCLANTSTHTHTHTHTHTPFTG